ncbi:magnesium chelatase subunit D [Aurantiacibacter poecillastricola]|uniref:magnesium chelatase subunit D n=1 Tax=Aurantiacibacter poecillastricola TaxID=3064385 RepID=UPI00273E26C8|nr:magnesium chelatase subunit D [Aurantiacibacter sp. 219JJ12-13]MDP5260370.1 magnesium chelatase subunit D [Aurantiacibacter sp. 219JJ12-13]
MSAPLGAVDPASEALLALALLNLAPAKLGGAVLRGGGPVRDELVERYRAMRPADAPWRRLPPLVEDDRLLGGIDIGASLAAGKAVHEKGLLAQASGGAILAPMAERMGAQLAGRLAQALDHGDFDFTLLLLDDGLEADERAPAALLDRVAFHCDLSGVRALESMSWPGALPVEEVAPLPADMLTSLAAAATALGIDSVRALLFAATTACAHAALHGRREAEKADLDTAARLVLAPRATQLPPSEAEEPPEDPAPSDAESGEDRETAQSDTPPEDQVLETALAAIPPDLLQALRDGTFARRAKGSGSGAKSRSKLRGRPLGARPGLPRGGARLALVDTLRAAVPWQKLRERRGSASITVLREDLRVKRFEERATSVTIFCVDASGSAAMARLAEAKGAVERLLAQAYATRSEVALVAFRKTEASVLLPPTRSLTRARRALAQLPGGGGTPLATGIATAASLAATISARGATPFLVLLTDGSANIAADGTPGRPQAREDAEAAARGVARSGMASLVIDISPRPRPDAEALAKTMRARYLPLPLADSAALERAVTAARDAAVTA